MKIDSDPNFSSFAFRVVFAYFALFGVASLLDVGNAPRALLASLYGPIAGWFGRSVFGLAGSPNDAGVPWALARQGVAVLVALGIATVWSLVSHRAEYARLHGWMRVVLRYYVAVVMLVYGAFKVIPTQFPPIALDQIVEPLGSLAPMGLLWSFMGYSPLYSMFTGLGETIGAFLLFFRRTTTAGALVLIAVLSNVALLNYAYDVPVKQLSVNLLFASIVLALPDARRLVDVLILNRGSQPADVAFRFPAWLQRVRRFLKPVVVIGATVLPLAFASRIAPRLREHPPLFGIYDVASLKRNGQVESVRRVGDEGWRQIVFGRPGTMTVETASAAPIRFATTVDTAARRVTYWAPRNPNLKQVLEYEPVGPTELRFRGVYRGDSIDVVVQRVPHEATYRLLRR